MKIKAVGIGYSIEGKKLSKNTEILKIDIDPTAYRKANGEYAGTVKERLNALHAAYKDNTVDMIIAPRGGYGAVGLLDKIDWALIKKNPKPYVGLSDCTAFQLALLKKCGQVSYTGALLVDPFFENPKQMLDTIQGKKQIIKGKTIHKGIAEGRLIGGCLSLVCQIIGTPFAPDFKNAIILLEDVGENAGRMESKLEYLRLCGIFEKCKGVVFGQFTKTPDAEKVIKRFAVNYLKGKPVICNIPYGHIKGSKVLPIGRNVRIENGNFEF